MMGEASCVDPGRCSGPRHGNLCGAYRREEVVPAPRRELGLNRRIATPTLIAWLLCQPTAVATAQDAWALMARHGECVSLADAAVRKPEFQGIAGPDELIAKLEAQGVEVHRQEIETGAGRAVLVDAPARGLNVIFVPPAACR